MNSCPFLTATFQETDRNSSGESGKSTPDPETLREWGLQVKRDTSMPPPASGPVITMPLNYILDSLSWTDNDNGKFILILCSSLYLIIDQKTPVTPVTLGHYGD